jgi:hypothetical protein
MGRGVGRHSDRQSVVFMAATLCFVITVIMIIIIMIIIIITIIIIIIILIIIIIILILIIIIIPRLLLLIPPLLPRTGEGVGVFPDVGRHAHDHGQARERLVEPATAPR